LAENAQRIAEMYAAAVAIHSDRRLAEAYHAYWDVMRADPPRPPAADELARVVGLAPRLYVTPDEPFPLRDAVAIIHPTEPLIAYHLFWDDDIDFPDDQEPADHEVVYVTYEPDGHLQGVYAYYHGHIITSDVAAARDGRPRIDVQWGKHGSLVEGWQELYEGQILADMRRTYERLHTLGRREQDNPLARHWPRTYTGTWEQFTDFAVEVDLAPRLADGDMVIVTPWANAALFTHFLRYNFRPKTDWPMAS